MTTRPVFHQYSAEYSRSMKIGVSLPEAQVAAARRAVLEGRATSVSAYISDALVRAERLHSLSELLSDLDRELGEPDAAASSWAEAELRRTGLLGL